jgi:hypothetical protein
LWYGYHIKVSGMGVSLAAMHGKGKLRTRVRDMHCMCCVQHGSLTQYNCNELFEMRDRAPRRSNSALGLGLETMRFFGGREVGETRRGRTERAICPCGPLRSISFRSIDNRDNPSHVLLNNPYVDMKDVKSVNQGKLKGLVKSTRTPPFYLAGTHRPRGARCDAVQFGLEKEGCLPKVRIGDCDQESDATCRVWRNIP